MAYRINTSDSEFYSGDARSAARVAVAQARNGRNPSAYAVVEIGSGVSVRRAEIFASSVERTAKSLVKAAN